jgi:hypothetical protein
LFTGSVFSVSIGQYFLGILPTDTEGKLGPYISVSKIWREPPFPYEGGGFGPLFVHFALLLRKKEFPRNFSKKEFLRNLQKVFPPKLMVQKCQPEYTDINRPVLVIYKYRPGGQYWDGKQL